MTVYNHFPTEADLFAACSTHWATHNPFPDPSAHSAIADPSARLVSVLREMYEWYGLKQGMLEKVLRDAPIVPSLAQVMDEMWGSYMAEVVRALAEGWSGGEVKAEALHAMLRVAVDFNTWKLLTSSGLGHDAAAELAAGMVTGGKRG